MPPSASGRNVLERSGKAAGAPGKETARSGEAKGTPAEAKGTPGEATSVHDSRLFNDLHQMWKIFPANRHSASEGERMVPCERSPSSPWCSSTASADPGWRHSSELWDSRLLSATFPADLRDTLKSAARCSAEVAPRIRGTWIAVERGAWSLATRLRDRRACGRDADFGGASKLIFSGRGAEHI